MANYNVGTTGIVVTANVENALQGLSKLRTTIGQVKQDMKGMVTSSKDVGNSSKETKKLDDGLKNVSNSSKKAQTELNRLIKTTLNFGALIYAFRIVSRVVGATTAQISSFGENFNLFNVSMRHNTEQALKFQYQVSRMYAVNMSNTMKYQGQFMNLAQALGIGTEQAYKMSEALTLLTYDIASLYNWSNDMAYNRVLAGIVGQTKPLRYAGIDVTQQTIQPILDELGIQKSVIQLTQQEKVMLRVIAVLRQSTNAQNDYSRTVESLANQLKIAEEQFAELQRWIGAIYYGFIKNLIPVFNATIMVLKEMAKAFAIVMGFSMVDFDFVSGKMNDDLIDFNEELENTDANIKKVQGGLRKFDEINNISLNTGSNVGLGGDSSKRLQEELNKEMDKYRAKLTDVQTKAEQIANTILTWLGYTRNVDEVTGEVSWTLEKMNGRLALILAGFTTLVTLPIVTFLVNLGKIFVGLTNIGAAATTTSTTTKTAFATLGGSISLLSVGIIAGITSIILAGIDLWNDTTQRAESFRTTLTALFDEIIETFNSFYEGTIKPVVDSIIENLGRIWEEGLKPLWEDFKVFAAPVIEILAAIASAILAIVVIAFNNFAPAIQLFIDMLGTAITSVLMIIGGLFRIVGGVLDVVMGLLTGNGNQIVNGFKNIFEGVAKVVYGIFYGIVNGIIDIFNFVIRTINLIPGVKIPLLAKVSYNGNVVKAPNIPSPSNNSSSYSGGGGGGSPTFSQVGMYASGGFPSKGEMFIMNEEEPEWIGNLGGRTAVMNKDQVVQSVLSLVDKSTNALSSSRSEQSQVVNLYADDILLGKAVIKSINKTSLATGLTIK